MDIGPESETRPVIGVSWEDAQAYCRWLSEQNKMTYELPTEAQWEFACRAGSDRRWFFGDDTIHLDDYAVCNQPHDEPPANVGTKQPNAFGLYDMHGNADEWCLDWHNTLLYSMSPRLDPAWLTTGNDPASGRVVRGGNWLQKPLWARSATRSYDFPGIPARHHGFRVAIIGDLTQAKLQPVEANPTRESEPDETTD